MAPGLTNPHLIDHLFIARVHIRTGDGTVDASLGDMKTQTQKLKEHEKSKDFFCTVTDAFRVAARRASLILGSAWAFAVAVLIILVWLATGPAFHYSDTWQLIINTGTTIVTFLMVFLIQNTQNRDAKATQLKLDEIIRAVGDARNELVNVENSSEEDLKKLEQQFARIRQRAERNSGSRDVPPIDGMD